MSAAESRMKVTIFSVSSLPLTKYFVPLFSDATHTVGMTGSGANGEEDDAIGEEDDADGEEDTTNARRHTLIDDVGCCFCPLLTTSHA